MPIEDKDFLSYAFNSEHMKSPTVDETREPEGHFKLNQKIKIACWTALGFLAFGFGAIPAFFIATAYYKLANRKVVVAPSTNESQKVQETVSSLPPLKNNSGKKKPENNSNGAPPLPRQDSIKEESKDNSNNVPPLPPQKPEDEIKNVHDEAEQPQQVAIESHKAEELLSLPKVEKKGEEEVKSHQQTSVNDAVIAGRALLYAAYKNSPNMLKQAIDEFRQKLVNNDTILDHLRNNNTDYYYDYHIHGFRAAMPGERHSQKEFLEIRKDYTNAVTNAEIDRLALAASKDEKQRALVLAYLKSKVEDKDFSKLDKLLNKIKNGEFRSAEEKQKAISEKIERLEQELKEVSTTAQIDLENFDLNVIVEAIQNSEAPNTRAEQFKSSALESIKQMKQHMNGATISYEKFEELFPQNVRKNLSNISAGDDLNVRKFLNHISNAVEIIKRTADKKIDRRQQIEADLKRLKGN